MAELAQAIEHLARKMLDAKTGEGWAYPWVGAYMHFFATGSQRCSCGRWCRSAMKTKKWRFYSDAEVDSIGQIDDGPYPECYEKHHDITLEPIPVE